MPRAVASAVTFSSGGSAAAASADLGNGPRVLLDLARDAQGRQHLRRRHGLDRRRLVLAADIGVHHAQNQHQHRRHQVDGDGAGPARQEVGGIDDHGRRRRQRLEARRLDRRGVEDLLGGGRQRFRLRRHRRLDLADHVGLALREIGGAAVGDRRDEAGDQPVGGALDRRRHRGLLQLGDHAHQRHRLLAEGVAASR